LGPVAFVCGVAFGDVFPFWALSGLYFLQNGLHVLVVQFLCSQSGWIPAGYGCSCNSLYLLDICSHLDFVAVSTLFLAWLLGKGISIVVFSALTVHGIEVVLL
jgi:hypothetical protein